MKNLFSEFREREIHHGQVFIEDGVIHDEKWSECKYKVMILLKEAYSSKNHEFDLRDLVKSWMGGNVPLKGGTWPNIARWSYGIISILSDGIVKNYPGKKVDFNSLLSIAVVNIKKSGGLRKSKNIDLIKYVKSDFDLIDRQIRMINPNIIVCGNTFELIKLEMINDIRKVSDQIYLHRSGYFFIDYWHPSSIYPYEMTYHALCSIVFLAYKNGVFDLSWNDFNE